MTALGPLRHRPSEARAIPPGFTVVELLVALAVGTLALGMVATLSSGVLASVDVDTAAADQQQRGRAGLAALVDDLQAAGSGFAYESEGLPGWDLPSVLPDGLRSGAWVGAAGPGVVSTVAGRRSAAHAVLATSAPAGAARLDLTPPRFCVSAECGFATGDDVLLRGRDGRLAFAVVRAVAAPLSLDLAGALGERWDAGTSVSAVTLATYATRADAATGLLQLTRARGGGPATTVVDYVTAFDVEWRLNGAAPRVVLAPDGAEAGTTEGPRPPAPAVTGDPGWPQGENCVFHRTAGGVAASRLPALGAGAVPVPLDALADGPWCPSSAAPSRWDADLIRLAEVRVTLRVAAAAAHLRVLPAGPARSTSRLVPDLTMTTTVRRGRRGTGA